MPTQNSICTGLTGKAPKRQKERISNDGTMVLHVLLSPPEHTPGHWAVLDSLKPRFPPPGSRPAAVTPTLHPAATLTVLERGSLGPAGERSRAQRYGGARPAPRPPPAARHSPEDDGIPHHDVVLGGSPAHPGRGILLQPAGTAVRAQRGAPPTRPAPAHSA